MDVRPVKTPESAIDTIVFDLGGVLVDWNPRYLYRQLFKSESEMEHFLANICHGPWNEKQDAGRPFSEATAELIELHPQHEAMIKAYFDRWPEMIAGEVPGTSEILAELHGSRKYRLLALSNWSHETFPLAVDRFEFFKYFEAVLLSGKEKLIKPDPRFFALLSSRFGVVPERALFIDDVEKNVKAAAALGFKTHLFQEAVGLRRFLTELSLLS